ncbi:TetR/AcrR family transcriptional regulator [Galbitalea sp. SE-J8]|uniref:TetR/AcrR family transcriptional regulator n=1 Tax=Galbitalea sp. SE-J8 TaxID=3054952 RepID=UPI00259CD91D|nr:TetR/AcrR family transcriptional regulator [Galbitalea sp. SE-J8]MDM4763432.1 TetR/AcrR family transcriptional regulator [Galbitalea sp. SE-J8]
MSSNSTTGTRPRTGNRRDDDARRAVLHAADDLLAEHGFAKLTIEAIARQAGVAKQTIYRWWPSKVEILLDGLIEGAEKYLPVPDGRVEEADVEAYFERFRRFVEELPDGKVFCALLGHAQHDQAAAHQLRSRFLDPRRERERGLIERAGLPRAGAAPAAVDALIDERVGAILWRAMTRAPVR